MDYNADALSLSKEITPLENALSNKSVSLEVITLLTRNSNGKRMNEIKIKIRINFFFFQNRS